MKNTVEILATALVSIVGQVRDQKIKAFLLIAISAIFFTGPAFGTALIAYFVKDVPLSIKRVEALDDRITRIEKTLHDKGFMQNVRRTKRQIRFTVYEYS